MNKKFITTQLLIVVRSSKNHAGGIKSATQTSNNRHGGILPSNPSGKVILTGNHMKAA